MKNVGALITIIMVVIVGIFALSLLKNNNSNNTTGSNNQTNNSGQCIITIQGNKYDVTSLRNTHSGGDVFICGTDMTQVYINQHGTDMNRISQYLIK